MNEKIAGKIGSILGQIGCLNSHLKACADTASFYKNTSLEKKSEQWFNEAVEKIEKIEKMIDVELWEMLQDERENNL